MGHEPPHALQKRLGGDRLKPRHAAPTAISCPQSNLEVMDATAAVHRGAWRSGVWPIAVRAQKPETPVVGFLLAGNPPPLKGTEIE
jgi:hypothetical protein